MKKAVEAAFRCGGMICSLIAFSLMGATSSHQQGAGSSFKFSFSDSPAYNYVVAINVIFFAYSTWQLILLGQVAEYGTSSTYDKLLSTYVFDQMLAFLLFSSSSAAATVAQLSHRGIHSIWPPACSTWSLASFCSRANAAVVLSFFSSLFAVVSFALSSYNLAKYMR